MLVMVPLGLQPVAPDEIDLAEFRPASASLPRNP